MFRTIQQILGLAPQNQFALAAEPMFTTFTSKPDFTPYTAIPNRIPLNEMNPSPQELNGLQRELAEFSMTIDSSEPDSAPADSEPRHLALGERIRHPIQLRTADSPSAAADAVAVQAGRLLATTRSTQQAINKGGRPS
jgi:hypothetical protein